MKRTKKIERPADEPEKISLEPLPYWKNEPAPEPDSTPAVLTAEAVQRQANKGRHSERTYNGGRRL
jgi:hypothetical protein